MAGEQCRKSQSLLGEIIRRVEQMANGRTRYEGYVPRWDEVLVAEIERLQACIPTAEQIREAAAAAMARFADPERAIVWFCNALGLTAVRPTDEDIAWAEAEMERINRVMQITNPAQVSALIRECDALQRDNAVLRAELARAPKNRHDASKGLTE